MTSTARIAALLAAIALPAAASAQGYYFRMSPSPSAQEDGGSPSPAPDGPPDAGTSSPSAAVAYDGWSGSPAAGNGPVGRFTATGLAAPVSYAASPGLPPGITLDSGGSLLGSYQAPGTYASTITATGADGASASAPYAVTVRPSGLAIRLAAPRSLVSGTTVSAAAPTVVSGQAVSWRLASGPDWASVAPGDGTVTLAPPPGTTQASYVVEASDATGTVAQASSGTIPVSNPTLSTASLPGSILEGVPAYGSLTSNIPGATFSLLSGPPWLSVTPQGYLSGHSGDISAAQSIPLSFRASGSGSSVDASAQLQVLPASVTLGAVPPSLHGGGRVTVPVTSDFGAQGSYSVAGAGWLSVDGSGNLVGTAPNVAATYQGLSVTAALNGASAQSGTFSIAVQPSTASATVPAKVRAGVPFTAALATNLSGGNWAASEPTSAVQFSVSGSTATVTAPALQTQVSYAPTFTYQGSDGTAAAAGSFTAYPDLVVTSTASGSPSLGGGMSQSYAAGAVNAIGTVTYDLLQNGSVNNAALSACGFTMNRATGSLSATSTTSCGTVANLGFRATDAGLAGTPGTGQTKDLATTFSISVTTPNAQSVTPISGSVSPVSAFWVYDPSRTSGTPYQSGWGPQATFSSCNNGTQPVYVYDFGQAVTASKASLGVYVMGNGQLPLTIKYSNDNKTWTQLVKMNPYYNSGYTWLRANATWGATAARYWAVFYLGYCGSADGTLSQIQFSN